ALPVDALMHLGDKTVLHIGEKTFCWVYENGHARRIEVETGVSDGEWIEVTNRRRSMPDAAASSQEAWTPIDGAEKVIVGNLSTLADGSLVDVTSPSAGTSAASRSADRPPKSAADASSSERGVAAKGPPS